MWPCNQLDLQTLGSQPVTVPKNLPDHRWKLKRKKEKLHLRNRAYVGALWALEQWEYSTINTFSVKHDNYSGSSPTWLCKNNIYLLFWGRWRSNVLFRNRHVVNSLFSNSRLSFAAWMKVRFEAFVVDQVHSTAHEGHVLLAWMRSVLL